MRGVKIAFSVIQIAGLLLAVYGVLKWLPGTALCGLALAVLFELIETVTRGDEKQ